MKKFILLSFCCTFAIGTFAQNMVKNAGFEEMSADDQLPRIAAFTDFGGYTQTANPTTDEEAVVQGEWYRKASNTGYLKAVVVDDDAQEGNKALKLIINKNSGQEKLDSWYSNTLVQYLALKDNTEYTITFHAKALDNAGKLYTGLLAGSDFAPLKGSKWIELSEEWTAYTLKIKTKGKANKSGIIFGLAATYDNNKTVASSVLIDYISVTTTN